MSVTKEVFYDSDLNIIDETDETLISYTDKFYGAYDRLKNRSTAEPSLKCNFKGMDGITALKYSSMKGVLSADEVAFAGATTYESGLSWNYYLKTNATGNFYFTLSPFHFFDYESPHVCYVYSVGSIIDDYVDSNGGSVRPAVVLRSDILLDTTNNPIEEQDGTQAHPYEV